MPLELWILTGLAAAVLIVGIARRLSGAERRGRAKETENVYPLW